MGQQQIENYQLDLFPNIGLENSCHSETGGNVNKTGTAKALQVERAGQQGRALSLNLMEQICRHDNIQKAYQQVKRNKGAAGTDGMTVEEFAQWYSTVGDKLIMKLIKGEYQPQTVRQVEIPKPNGSKRMLGIPTVIDRVIQQAIMQVLSPLYEQQFSEYSYGFRPKRRASQALKQASKYVAEGRNIVVDMDLATFFDVVDHDRLMHRLSKDIGDKTLLKLIRRYLQSGIMVDGVVNQRVQGTPQGSPLSPLLSNIVLDELDKELERRGHCFVRYADDCNIFVNSRKAGERVLQSLTRLIEGKLKLKVNQEKSKVCNVSQSKFLGYTIQENGKLSIALASLLKLKDKIRTLTARNRGVSLQQIISELNVVLKGWINYFQYSEYPNILANLDGWIRRKLRCYRIKQCKRVYTLYKFIKSMGVKTKQSWMVAASSKGWWHKSKMPAIHQAMGNKWFAKQGLFSLASY